MIPSREDGCTARESELILRLARAIETRDFAAAMDATRELAAGGSSGSTGFHLLSQEELCAPLQPVRYALEALDICPGRPTQITGTGFAGKTIAVQSMLTSMILGRPVWDEFACRGGPCVHLDYEMGRRATLNRYRRLALGMGASWEQDIAPHLRLASLPSVFLNTPGVSDHLRRVAEGMSVVVIDSLRRALPGVNENDSAIAVFIDVMTKVSEETGAAFLFLHHSTTKSYGEQGDPKGAGRGSSAIFDSSGAVLSLSGSKGAPVRVTQTKAPERGTPAEDFYLSIDDVAIASDPRAGVTVRYTRLEDAKAVGEREPKSEEDVARIVRAVDAAGPEGLRGAEAVTRSVGVRAERGRAALKVALERGLVVNVAVRNDGSPDERHPHYVVRRSSRPLKGTGRALHDSSDERRDEQDERLTEGHEHQASAAASSSQGLDRRSSADYASNNSAPAPLATAGGVVRT